MLGELYEPRGKALEHARVVLEVDAPHAVNVALGCPVGCSYCYGPGASRQSRESWRRVRRPRERPVELVRRQIDRGLKPDGVFISFLTEPLLLEVRESTEDLAALLVDRGVRVAVSSKLGVSSVEGIRHGVTAVSMDPGFSRIYEGGAPLPTLRVEALREAHGRGEYTWASLEPCPCPGIWEHDLRDVLGELRFADLLVLGKWNYDRRASTAEAREYYRGAVDLFRGFCSDHGIRHHVKADTLKFVGGAARLVEAGVLNVEEVETR